MYTGWKAFGHKGYEIDRKLRFDERYVELERKPQSEIEPDEMASLIHFNSTYADFIDRRYRLRGMVATTVYLLVIGILLYFYAFILFKIVVPEYVNKGVHSFIIDFVFFSALFLLPVVFAWWIGLRHDFFTYTRYPIRFNRKTRMVHAFRHNGPGGVVSVPWEQAFFFICKRTHDLKNRDT